MASEYPAFSLRLIVSVGLCDPYDVPLSKLKALASTPKSVLEKMQARYDAKFYSLTKSAQSDIIQKESEQEVLEKTKYSVHAEKELTRGEQENLYRISHTKKPDSSAFINHLTSHSVRYFYHFTDRRNLDSILSNGGLYSWKYCKDNGIAIPWPGGDATSRSLDEYHGLSDYVRLSFCSNHPMRYHVNGRGGNTVLLRIKVDVAGLEGTLFSDINASSFSSVFRMLYAMWTTHDKDADEN